MNILHIAKIAGKLKRLPRTGWIRYAVKDPESVAEHSFRTAFLAMILAPHLKIDQAKAIKMALIHDLAESKIGDIVVRRGEHILPLVKEKGQRERAAMAKIAKLIETEDILALFDEYEENETPVAKFVRQLDKLEMAIQADEYENEQQLFLEEFFITTRHEVIHKELRKILKELEMLRRKKL